MSLTVPKLDNSEPYYNKIYSRHHDMINVIAWSCYHSGRNKAMLARDVSLNRSYHRNDSVVLVLESAVGGYLVNKLKLNKKLKERTLTWF